MSVAVVILNYNGIHLLQQFLPSVVANSNYPWCQVYVIDNASTDASVEFIKATFPTVKVIVNNKNYGFAGGYNVGLKTVTENTLVLLNSDVEVTPNWLPAAVNHLNNNKHVAALQPKILSWFHKTMFDYAGAAGGCIDRDCFPFCRGRVFNQVEEDNNRYNTITDIFWASGAALFIKNELFVKVGGFDADLFAHMEEIDLCWRLKNSGYQIQYFPGSAIYHMGGATLSKSSPYKTYLNFRNNLIVIAKNLPARGLGTRLFRRMFLDFLAWLHFLAKGEFSFALSVNKAHYHFLKALPATLVKRKQLASKPLTQLAGVYRGSIIYRFFISGKKNSPL